MASLAQVPQPFGGVFEQAWVPTKQDVCYRWNRQVFAYNPPADSSTQKSIKYTGKLVR